MYDSSHRATLIALLVLTLGVLFAAAATTGGLLASTPWWALVFVLATTVPRGSWSARSARSRLVAAAALLASALLLVGGRAASDSFALVALVAVPLWIALTMLLVPRLHGRRAVGVVLFVLPLVLTAAALPAALGTQLGLGATDPAAGVAALAAGAGPTLLLGGAAMLAGTVLDLAARLRTVVSAEAVRSIAFVVGGLTLVLVAAAGAVAAGTLSGTASRIGALGVVLAIGAAAALRRGLTGLERTGEVSRVGGAMAMVSVASVLAGTMLSPPSTFATIVGLSVLLILAAVLGSVTGLCGAAALVRTRRELATLRSAPARVAGVVRTGLRARHAHS